MKTETHQDYNIFHTLGKALKDGLFRYDMSGIWLFINPAMLQLFDMKDDQTLDFHELFADETTWQDVMANLKRNGQLVQQRILFKRRDKRNFWGTLTCKKVEAPDNVWIDGLITNIDDVVSSELQLREKANALEKSMRELDRFIYSASHDLRAPISSMLGIINVMKLDQGENKTMEYATMLETSALKLDNFIRDLTRFARNARQLKEDVRIDFHEIIQELKSDFATRLENIELETTINDSFQFYSDPFRVRLILYNVVKNAIDYGDYTKPRSWIAIQVNTTPAQVQIDITDTGIGIAPVHVNNVFDMFYRAATSSRGAGLGLYIAREAAIKLSGNITLQSEYGVGTTVHIEIPNSTKGILINRKKNLRQQSMHRSI